MDRDMYELQIQIADFEFYHSTNDLFNLWTGCVCSQLNLWTILLFLQYEILKKLVTSAFKSFCYEKGTKYVV